MWLLSGRCYCQTRLEGKIVVITGANCGIGKATALDLYRRGARVILACRDMKKADEAADDIRRETKDLEGAGEVVVVRLDLMSLASVRQCAKELLRTERAIHVLVNNAGICHAPHMVTEDGFEGHIGTNHLGHFLLTCLLLPRIIRSGSARIVTVSSMMNYFPWTLHLEDLHWKQRSYNSFLAYSESKLANLLFSVELARRLQGTDVTTYAPNPGMVVSQGGRHISSTWFPGATWIFEKVTCYIFKTCEQGAQTSVHCAVSEELGRETGLYYSDCKTATCHSLAKDEDMCRNLWEESARQVGLGDWDPFTAEDPAVQ